MSTSFPPSCQTAAAMFQTVRGRISLYLLGFLITVCSLVAGSSSAPALPYVDFKSITDAARWFSVHITALQPTTEGLAAKIAGPEPYLLSPVLNFPTDHPLQLHLRLKSEQGGRGRLWYFKNEPHFADAAEFDVASGAWIEATAAIPPLPGRWRLRLDLPGHGGSCLLDSLWFTEREPLHGPPPLTSPVLGSDPLLVRSGELELRHDRKRFGAFKVLVAGEPMAAGHVFPTIYYRTDSGLQSVCVGLSSDNPVRAEVTDGELKIVSEQWDADKARWRIEQRFVRGLAGSIDVETRVTVDRDRMVAYLPLFELLPGLGSFGTNKTQGLFCGLEYLENESSSSEADVTGPEAKRQVPGREKITIPLMSISAQGRYLGLIWQSETNVAAAFDSPDRIFGSASHFMGLLFPPTVRPGAESRLLSFAGALLRSNECILARATIIGGRGRTIVPALQQYVALRGLPPVPGPVPVAEDFFKLMAHGWLDSVIRTNALFYYHPWPDAVPQAATDVAVWMHWLSQNAADQALRARLQRLSTETVNQIASAETYNDSQIGHAPNPLPALIYRAAIANALRTDATAYGFIPHFEADGTVIYRPAPGGRDYGITHYAPDANGHTAELVQPFLEQAAFAGNRRLLDTALQYLRMMDKFRDTVPRGAETYSVPLHTPDLLASARLLRCYTLGYELTGDAELLEQARFWAWSGVPFVYLVPPTPGGRGTYATLAAFGAAGWVSPLFGRPILWSGLVYADALYRFAKYDPAGPWRQLADGITGAAIQVSFLVEDPRQRGLLPGFFPLASQLPAGSCENPILLQSNALHYYGLPTLYDFHVFRTNRLIVHSPGELADLAETSGQAAFTVKSWSSDPASVLISGFSKEPRVRINGEAIPLRPPHQFHAKAGLLELQVQGVTRIEILAE